MARVIRRESAKRDLTIHFAYIGEHASIELAERFLRAAEKSFKSLSQMPDMGALSRLQHGKSVGVRILPIQGFERYLIIYRPLGDGVQIERVIHAAQDYHRVLAR